MKKTSFTTIFLIVIVTLFMMSFQSFAQTQDTIRVYADYSSGPTIEQFIMGDTTSTGQRKHPDAVYLLQQTGAIDTPYYYTDPIQLSSNLTIVGKTNPVTGMPPVIQPGIRQNNSSPNTFISANTPCTITLKYLYILGLRYDTIQATSNLIQANGDSTNIIVDHCVIDNANGTLANFHGNWNKLFLTNTDYRDISNQFWQSGNAMWDLFGVPMDTVIIENNTFFCMGRAVYGGPGYYKYLRYEHNTNFLGTGGLLLSTHMTNAVISNNIFYGVIAHGADTAYIARKNANDAAQGFGVVMMDSLGQVGVTYGISEAQRNVKVENNAYVWPQALYTYWNSVNQNAPNTVVPPVWMNPQTVKMFNDKTDWPGFTSANNDSVDPGFDPATAGPAVDSLVKFVNLIGYPPGNAGNFRWWALQTNPYPGYIFAGVPKTWKGWNDGYPVPENLKYSNTALYHAGTDGLPLGDLNWFPNISGVKQISNTTPTKFQLAQNYPNPFNPTTIIKYELPKSGLVSLSIYNILGQKVATLFNGFQKSGVYKVNFDASKLASGVYLYRLEANGLTLTKKMVLLK